MVEIPKVQFYHFSSNAFLVTLIVEFYFCFLLEVVFFFFFFSFPPAVRCTLQMAQTVPPIVAHAQDFTYVKCDLQHFL